jgi:hypothetical protein
VEDRFTARFMDLFYDGLVAGRPRAEALGLARRAVMADGRHAHPHYWAAFVLAGEHAAPVPLRARRQWPWAAASAAAVVILLLLAAVAVRRSRRRRGRATHHVHGQ